MLSSLRRGRSQARPAAILDTAALLAALPDPVLALDRAGIVRYVNPAAEQFFGIGAAALCGTPLADLVVPHSPIFTLLDAVGRSGGSIAEYDVALEGPRLAPRSVTIQGAPAGEGSDLLVGELAHGLQDHFFFVAQAKIHPGTLPRTTSGPNGPHWL